VVDSLPIEKLTVDQLAHFLAATNLGQFIDQFKAKSIDGATIACCDSKEDLEGEGVTMTKPRFGALRAAMDQYRSCGVPLTVLEEGRSKVEVTLKYSFHTTCFFTFVVSIVSV